MSENFEKNTLTAVSNKIVLSRSNFSVPQRRILSAIIESISPLLKQEITNLRAKAMSVEPLIDERAKITYKASNLSRPEDYGELRKALNGLQQRLVEWEYEEDGERVLVSSPLLGQHKFRERSEIVEMWVFNELYTFLLDLSLGYTMYQTQVVLSFTSIYAMRMYEILAKWRNKRQFYISIDELRWLTDTQTKFDRNNDFKRFVLDVAKQQMDESQITDLRFDYEEKKKGRKLTGFTFFIYKTTKAHDHPQKHLSPPSLRWDFSKELSENFKRFGLNIKGKNLETVKALKVLLGEKKLAEKLESLYELAIDKKNPAGYIIASLKNELINEAQENDPEPIEMTVEQRKQHAEKHRTGTPGRADFLSVLENLKPNNK